MSQDRDGVIVSIGFVKRKPEMTTEQFHDHWLNVHGPLIKPWMLKHGFLSYRQCHNTVKPEGAVGSSSDDVPNPMEYDGYSIIEAKDMSAFVAAMQDEYYTRVIKPDEDRFIDKTYGVLRVRGEMHRLI